MLCALFLPNYHLHSLAVVCSSDNPWFRTFQGRWRGDKKSTWLTLFGPPYRLASSLLSDGFAVAVLLTIVKSPCRSNKQCRPQNSLPQSNKVTVSSIQLDADVSGIERGMNSTTNQPEVSQDERQGEEREESFGWRTMTNGRCHYELATLKLSSFFDIAFISMPFAVARYLKTRHLTEK